MAPKAENEPKIDYRALGLKCGLEIHQQLDTDRKLFCYCKTDLRQDKPLATIKRYMRPTLSELGKYDEAALMEFKKQKEIIYEIHDSVCTYEIDETPPFRPDKEAIDLAITISKLFNMDIIDELHVNRKQYLDGSIPTGFQRTMIVGSGGFVLVDGEEYYLDILALEEDSCREVEDKKGTITWRVDRLGTPLVEIATKTFNVEDPETVKEVAEAIGRTLRATGKVKRGLGTIRQDLNISIRKGVRVELKGVQMLHMLPQYVSLEVERQTNLIELKKELQKRNLTARDILKKPKDCHEILEKTSSKALKKALKKKQEILGIKLPRMKGLLKYKLQDERTFGKEIADRIKVIVGLGGIIHTDELPAYGITSEEKKALRKFFDCKKDDAVVLVIGDKDRTDKAIDEMIIRINEAFQGVPVETRHANDDGTSRFERYLGGASRMYPDTDSVPIPITESRVEEIVENLPELPEQREKRYIEDYNLPPEIASDLAISPRVFLFNEIVKMGIEPITVAVALEQTLKALERDNIPIENLSDERIKNIFQLLLDERITKEAIEPLFEFLAKNPKTSLNKAIIELDLETISKEKLQEIINKLIEEQESFIEKEGERAMGKLMGRTMDKVRGKVDGQIVKELLKQALDNKITSLEEKEDKEVNEKKKKKVDK
jgi:glutamyl-tRNA(Gln) amidotransferase subunit E